MDGAAGGATGRARGRNPPGIVAASMRSRRLMVLAVAVLVAGAAFAVVSIAGDAEGPRPTVADGSGEREKSRRSR